jgi:hypothetical protein
MPRGEFSVGYTYARLDQNLGLGSNNLARLNGHGVNTGVSVSINPRFAVEGNYTGVFNGQISAVASPGVSSANVATETHNMFAAGPRINFGTGGVGAFVHGLVGVDHETISAAGGTAGQTSSAFAVAMTDSAFATALGGGLEFGARRHVGLLTGGDYLLTRHALPSAVAQALGVSGKPTQNSFRASVSLVFHFGALPGR